MKSLMLAIAGRFSKAGITWAIGGSWVLKRHGIDTARNDIDIITTTADFDKADAILSSMGTRRAHEPHAVFKSLKYAKFGINGYEVDLIACFQIVHDQGVYTYDFSKRSISLIDSFSRGTINYTSLEDWYILYLLMGRPRDKLKFETLEAHFRANGIERRDLLEAMLEHAPAGTREYVINKFPR